MLPPDILLWQKDYFVLKAIKKQIQEILCFLPFHKEERTILIVGDNFKFIISKIAPEKTT